MRVRAGRARRRVCRCQLTRADIIVDCIVRLNPSEIARSFFDPDADHPRGYEGRLENGGYVPESPGHLPLEDDSVLIHERRIAGTSPTPSRGA